MRKRHFCEGLTIACALLVSIFAFGVSDARADQSDERAALQLIRASHLAATGQCAEAMSIAEASPVRDAAMERLIGKCSIQAQQYTKALFSLKRATELDSSLVGVSLYSAVALYHLQDYAGARTALDNARVVGEEQALVDFYSGLLLMRDDRPRESALAFERAATRGPNLVEPVASYYAALAWQSLDENEPLQSAADRVMNEEPDGAWAREAKSLLALQAERHRGGQTDLQRWASLKVGVEHDSNVVLRGQSQQLPSNISGDNDVRGVWALVLGAELFEVKGNTVGAMVSYSGNAHDDLVDFDQHYIAASSWIDHEFRPTTLGRLRMNVGYGWFGGDPFVVNGDLTGLVEERWGRWGTTRCTLGVAASDFRYGIEVLPEYKKLLNQDGIGLRLGCDHELPVTLLIRVEPTIYAGYHFAKYFADGREWDQDAHEIKLGVRAKLPLKVDLDASGSYTRRDFFEASYFASPSSMGPDRNEDSFQLNLELAREFKNRIEVSGRYQYTFNDSNTPVFKYKRHVVGAYVELKFP